MAKTSCQKASKGMYSGSQCQASSVLQGALAYLRTGAGHGVLAEGSPSQ